MNKIYKVVFNKSLSTYVAVSELAKGHSKSSKNKTSALVAAGLISIAGVASASYLSIPKPQGGLDNVTYHPESVTSRVIVDDIPVGNEELSEYKSFVDYYSKSVLKGRKYESDSIEGKSHALIGKFKEKSFYNIPKMGFDSDLGNFNKRLKTQNDTRFFLSYENDLVSVLDKTPLIDTDTLHTKINRANVTGLHFGFAGRVIQFDSTQYALSQKNKNRSVQLDLFGSNANFTGHIFSSGKAIKIQVLDGASLTGNSILGSKQNELKLSANSDYQGNINFYNQTKIKLFNDSSLFGDITAQDVNSSFNFLSYGSYHDGEINLSKISSNTSRNIVGLRYGSRQIGDISLPNTGNTNNVIAIGENSIIIGSVKLGSGNNSIQSFSNDGLGTSLMNSAVIGNITGVNKENTSNNTQNVIQLKNTDIVGDISLYNSKNTLSLSSVSTFQGSYVGGSRNDVLKFDAWTLVNKNSPKYSYILNDGINSVILDNHSEVYGNIVGGVNSDSLVVKNQSLFEGNIDLGNAENLQNGGALKSSNVVYLKNLSKFKGNVTGGKDKDEVFIGSSLLEGNVDLAEGANIVYVQGDKLGLEISSIPKGLNLSKYSKAFGFLTYDDVEYGSLLKGNLNTGSGNDTLFVSVGEVQGNVSLGSGNNKILVKGGTASGSKTGTVEVLSKHFTSKITGALITGDGNDSLAIEDAEIGGDINLGNGSNSVSLSKNSVTKGNITTGVGDDTINIYGKSQNKVISTSAGDDIVRIVGTPESIKESVLTSVDGGEGYDIFDVSNSGHVSLKAENAISNIESIYISGNSSLELKGPADIKLSTSADKAGTDVTIDSGSSLVINHNEATADYNLGYNLSGDGTLKLDLNNHKLNLSGGDQSEFSGTVELSRGQIELNDKVKELLADSSLVLKEGGVLHATHKASKSNEETAPMANASHAAPMAVVALARAAVASDADSSDSADEAVASVDEDPMDSSMANATTPAAPSSPESAPQATPEEPSTIKSLTLDGGALHLAKHTPVGQTPSASLKVKDLKVVAQDGNEFGKGFIVVESFNKYDNTVASGNNKTQSAQGLLSQDDGEFVANLVEASGNVQGNGIKLEIRKDQNSSSDAVHTTDILQGNEVVARANFGYKARVDDGTDNTKPKGINAVYGLKEIELLEGKQLDLVVDGTESKSDLSAKLTGTGGIDINKDGTDTTVLSLSNPANDYKGATRILKGTLLAKSSNVLGSEESHTKTLKLADNTKLKLADAVKVYVGNVDQATSSKLDLGNGTLNIVHDGETKESTIKANSLIASAEGGVVLHNGQTTFEGPQDSYKGTTTIRNKAHASIANVKALGTGAVDIQDKGTLNLNLAEAAELTNQIKGNGTVIKYGKGALTLNPSERTSAFEGTINLSEGSLIAGTTASPLTLNAKEINVLEGNTLQAVGTLKGSLNNAGIVQIGSGNVPGDTYTVGNYDGAEGSEVQLSAEWKKSGEFKSDKLVVLGIATGKTKVKAGPENLIKGDIMQGDTDKFSTDVIEVAKVHEGNVFFGQAETDGAFKADLVKVGNNYRWKIGAKLNPATPTFIAGKLASIINVYDSVGTLSERVAAQRHAMNAGGNVFGRISHGNAKLGSLRGQEYAFKDSQIQFGVGMLTSHGKDHSKTEVGLLASYGKNDVTVYDGETGSSSLFNFKGIGKNIAKTFSKKKAKAKGNEVAAADTKPKAKKVGSIDSNVISLGLYTTGYLASGVYYDVVAQVSGIKNKYTTEDKKTSSQNGLATQLSVEVGHALPLGDSGWSATPQVQVVGQYLKLGGYKHAVRKIDLSNDFSVRGRVGLSIAHEDDFYVSANVLGELTKPLSLKVGKDTVKESFNKYWGEVGVGGQVNLSKSSAFYADAKFIKNFTGEKRTGYKGNVGFKYSW